MAIDGDIFHRFISSKFIQNQQINKKSKQPLGKRSGISVSRIDTEKLSFQQEITRHAKKQEKV